MKDQMGYDIEIGTYYVTLFRMYGGKQRVLAGKVKTVIEPDTVVLEDVCVMTMEQNYKTEVVSAYELTTRSHKVDRKILYWLHPDSIKETYHDKAK